MFETHVTIRKKGTCDLLLRLLRTQVYYNLVHLVEYIVAVTYWTLFERKRFLISTNHLDLYSVLKAQNQESIWCYFYLQTSKSALQKKVKA